MLVLDVSPLNGPRAGVARYVQGLLFGISQLSEIENVKIVSPHPVEEMDYLPSPSSRFLYSNSQVLGKLNAIRSRGFPGENLYRFLQRHLVTNIDKDSTYHILDFGIFFHDRPVIVTAHDTIAIDHPEWFSSRIVREHEYKLDFMIRYACKIISVSESTKNDLMRLGVDGEKIHVTPLAVFPVNQSMVEFEKTAEQSMQDYFLFVGTMEPRKNLEKILEAFRSLFDKYGSRCPDLVIAGGAGWGKVKDRMQSQLMKQKVSDKIHIKGYVADRELGSLYRNAKCFLYPSLYEGFGLPVLEAMSFGTPVITSNHSAMKEYFSEAAILCDPLDPESIEKAMERILEPGNRKIFSEKSLELVQKFSWKETAKKTLNVYGKVPV